MTEGKSVVDLSALRATARWHWPEYAVWVVPILSWFAFPDNYALLATIAITALFALSMDLILGIAGIVSLGHAAFFGLGAYVAGWLPLRFGIGDPMIGLVIAAAVTGLAGGAASLLVLRGSGLTRLMVTIGIGMMLFEAANKLSDLTGGVDGLQGIEFSPLLGRWTFDLYGRAAYIYSVAVLFAVFLVARRIVHSPFGLSLTGIRQNNVRMSALGVRVNARLMAIYAISAACAGIAGALLTQTTQFVSIEVFSFSRSAEILLIVILGGVGRLYGALLGAIIFTVAHHILSDLDPKFWQLWIGLCLIALVLFARNGVLGGIDAAGRGLLRWRAK